VDRLIEAAVETVIKATIRAGHILRVSARKAVAYIMDNLVSREG
jgi:hypothetical protein